jgi:hypothetical protein
VRQSDKCDEASEYQRSTLEPKARGSGSEIAQGFGGAASPTPKAFSEKCLRATADRLVAYGQSVVKVTPRALNVAMFCACAVQSIGLLRIAMAVP